MILDIKPDVINTQPMTEGRNDLDLGMEMKPLHRFIESPACQQNHNFTDSDEGGHYTVQTVWLK